MNDTSSDYGTWLDQSILTKLVLTIVISLLLNLIVHWIFVKQQVTSGDVLDKDWQHGRITVTKREISTQNKIIEKSRESNFDEVRKKQNNECNTLLIKDILDIDEWSRVLKTSSSRPVVLKFTACWCKPCQKIDPWYEVLSRRYDACFVRIDVDKMEEVCDTYEVNVMPTFIVFRYGKMVGKVDGASEFKLGKLIEKYCNPIRKKVLTEENSAEAFTLTEEKSGEKIKVLNENKHEEKSEVLTLTTENSKKPELTNEKSEEKSLSGGKHETKKDFLTKKERSSLSQNEIVTREIIRPCLKSSSDHPGLSEFNAWYSAISDMYRQYIISTIDEDAPAPILPRSERGYVSIKLEVLNSTIKPVDVFWINYKGKEEWKGSCASGSTWHQTTWIGHPWTFRAQGGRILLHYVPYRVIPTTDKVVTVTTEFVAIQRFTIKNSKNKKMCEIMDPVLPFPSINSISKALEWSYRQMERESTSPRTLIKYLKNILLHPSDTKFRQIRTANKTFWNQVWITAGRGVLHSLGFQENGPYIEMGPNGMLHNESIQLLSSTIFDLETLLPYIEGHSNLNQQPRGADGIGRANWR